MSVYTERERERERERASERASERERQRERERERERQRDRETERQRDRETERQRDRETERQRDRETERQRDRERGRRWAAGALAVALSDLGLQACARVVGWRLFAHLCDRVKFDRVGLRVALEAEGLRIVGSESRGYAEISAGATE